MPLVESLDSPSMIDTLLDTQQFLPCEPKIIEERTGTLLDQEVSTTKRFSSPHLLTVHKAANLSFDESTGEIESEPSASKKSRSVD